MIAAIGSHIRFMARALISYGRGLSRSKGRGAAVMNSDQIIETIDNACDDLSLNEYMDTLEDVIENLQIKLEAAQADARRQGDDDE